MTKSLQKRLRVFMVSVVFVTLMLTARLAWLQIYQYEIYVKKAENNRLRDIPITATRGEMKDTHGELLATNRPGFAVSLLDVDKDKAAEVVRELSNILDMPEKEIREKIKKQQFKSFAPIRIADDVSHEVVAQITERRMELPGVIIETPPVRVYPQGTLAAHALGYVGTIWTEQYLDWGKEKGYRLSDIVGQSGLESTYESHLRGTDGVERVETNHYNQRVRPIETIAPIPGNNLTLTLDARLQRIAEKAIHDVITGLREGGNDQAGKGAVVAIDPKTGGILAMVSYPAFNPNTFYKDYKEGILTKNPDKPLTNKAIGGAYPIGSTYKMIVSAAGLEEGLINRNSVIVCSGRKAFFRGDVPRGCHDGAIHGGVDVMRSLQVSCNNFYYQLGVWMGIDTLTKYAEDFGLSKPTGLTDLVGERKGSLLRKKEGKVWNPGDVLTAAIGQGHEITPLQLANYGAILANRGTHYRPHLVKEITSHDGKVIHKTEPEVLNTLDYNEETWQAIQEGLELVTSPGGTASIMRKLPVKVAAKTGSAQASQSNEIKSHSLFLGYAPAENPEIVLAVIVEHGGLGYQGAVPTAFQIFNEYYTTAEPAAETATN